MTKYENDLERFEEDIEDGKELSVTENDYYQKLLLLGECQRGLDQARGIQTEGSYVVSETWTNPHEMYLESFDYRGAHARLSLAVEECHAQIQHLLPMLGEESRNKGVYFDTQQDYHGDNPIVNWETVPTHESNSSKLTEHDFKQSEQDAIDDYCNSDNADVNKEALGCVIDQTKPLQKDGSCRMGYVFNDDRTACKPSYYLYEDIYPNGNFGNQGTYYDPLAQLSTYRHDQGAEQLEQILKEIRDQQRMAEQKVQESHK